MRESIDLNHDWQFNRDWRSRWWLGGAIGKDAESVSLPHSWNAHDSFEVGLRYYRGYGCYRKRLALSQELRREDSVWRLVSSGFYGTGDVWLNGQKVAAIDGQYLGFALDVSEILRFKGENTLGIRLTNRCARHVLPGIKMPDFVLYGGLACEISLERRSSLHIGDDVCIRTRTDPDGTPAAVVCCSVVNVSSKQRSCRLDWAITGAKEAEIRKTQTTEVMLGAGESRQMECVIQMPDARRWSVDDPILNTACGTLLENDAAVDVTKKRFGVRDAEFRPAAGFFLNGKRVELRGVNRHESMPGVGNALSADQHRTDARIIKDGGLNFVRLSHYPQHQVFLDACDELGILVYAEIATWKSVRTGRWLKSALRQMHAMIERDRNHPSVILWGMGNESRSLKAYTALREAAHSADPTRPVIYAENHLYRARRQKTLGLPDVWGCNYELDELEEGRDASRLRNVVVSECSNYPHTVRGDVAAELEQVRMIEEDLARIRDKPYVAGFALWCFNDYGTLRKGRFIRHSGIVDGLRNSKLSMALLKAMFCPEPALETRVAHGATEGATLHVFTNCEDVQVIVDGTEAARLSGAPHLLWSVPAGSADIVIKGTLRGNEIVRTASMGQGK